jgi:hypothetical protein
MVLRYRIYLTLIITIKRGNILEKIEGFHSLMKNHSAVEKTGKIKNR